MHLNLNKIDERIQKLQEVKRIANDPDLLRMIGEFLVADDRALDPVPAPKAAVDTVPVASHADDDDMVDRLMKGSEFAGAGNVWSRTRAAKGA